MKLSPCTCPACVCVWVRPAAKYRVAGSARTQTQAGQVQGESFIYVDKETGLPLRIEGFGQSTGNVQGVTGGNVVIETRDLKTDVNPTDFEIPQGYRQLSPEEVRQRAQQHAEQECENVPHLSTLRYRFEMAAETRRHRG